LTLLQELIGEIIMTLQQLIGELLSLSNSYPDTTPIRIADDVLDYDLELVEVQSDSSGIEIHLKG